MTADVSVAAAVTTFNRRDVLRRCLTALFGQTRPPDDVIVVDNASTDGTADLVAEEFPEVRLLRMTENSGAAGGFAVGIAEAVQRGHEWVWLFNDDDVPVSHALASLLERAARTSGQAGIMACGRCMTEHEMHSLGGRWHHRHRALPMVVDPSTLVPADVVAFSGTLVPTSLVREIGLPRADFFMMMEELEYCLRARRSGADVWVLPLPLVTSLTMGSAGSSAPWRGYYQTRNHALMLRSEGDIADYAWWLWRTAKFTAGAVVSRDQTIRRIKLRMLGAWHGVRGVSGRTVEPDEVVANGGQHP